MPTSSNSSESNRSMGHVNAFPVAIQGEFFLKQLVLTNFDYFGCIFCLFLGIVPVSFNSSESNRFMGHVNAFPVAIEGESFLKQLVLTNFDYFGRIFCLFRYCACLFQ